MLQIDKIKGKKILVIGDLMLDIYLSGKAFRISPEAPVPVITAKKKTLVPGGSANVVANLAEIGCDVTVVGFVGRDDEGEFLRTRFGEMNVKKCIIDTPLPTVCKTRVLANGQHIVRYDVDSDFNTVLNKRALLDMLQNIASGNKFDVIVVSDYDKGTINRDVMSLVKEIFSYCPILCDIKPMNKDYFEGVWAIFPNLGEAKQMIGNSSLSVDDMARFIKDELSLRCVIITMADDGIYGLDENDNKCSFKAHINIDEYDPRQRFDVTGAGDTVISVFAACVASGMNTRDSLYISNVAAGIVVNKIGTAVCGYEELEHEIKKT